jgi:hypothetical protein
MGGQESSIVTDYILKVHFASCESKCNPTIVFCDHVIQI